MAEDKIKELIESASTMEFNQAKEIFDELMAEKMTDQIDEQRAIISELVYNSDKEELAEVVGLLTRARPVIAWIKKNGLEAWRKLTKKEKANIAGKGKSGKGKGDGKDKGKGDGKDKGKGDGKKPANDNKNKPKNKSEPAEKPKTSTAGKVVKGTTAAATAGLAAKELADLYKDVPSGQDDPEEPKTDDGPKGRQDGPDRLKPKNLKTKAKSGTSDPNIAAEIDAPGTKEPKKVPGPKGSEKPAKRRKGRDADLAAKYNPDRRRSGKVTYDPDRKPGEVYADQGKDFSKLSRAERARRAAGPGHKSSLADRLADAEKNMVKGDMDGLDRIRKSLGQKTSKKKIPTTDRMSGPEMDDGSFPKSKKKSSKGMTDAQRKTQQAGVKSKGKDPNIAAEIDAGGTKGGSGVGRQDGPGKPKRKNPNIAAEIDAGGTKGGSGVGRKDGPDRLKPKADPMKGAKERMKKRWEIGAKNIST